MLNAAGCTLTITNSTISGNQANNGGGIYNSGTLTITSSTVSTNTTGLGGGIYNNGGTLTIVNSTISGNSGRQRRRHYDNDSGPLSDHQQHSLRLTSHNSAAASKTGER